MKHRLLFMLALFISIGAQAQNWSSFLDSSRAIDWTSGVGFTIPSYSVNCTTQPKLTANSSAAASANSTAIQNALASCDATHNVVNIPAGTYYVAGITYPDHGNQVLRGAGPNSTTLISTGEATCNGATGGICMALSTATYDGNSAVLPSSGSQQCSWTAGYAKGTSTITLSNCGGAPPLNAMIVLDQANDSSDTGGIYICDSAVTGCTYNDGGGNHNGRVINGVTHSQQQVVYTTGVVSAGSGSYSVTISPSVYFTNIRSGQAPGAWWAGTVQHDGLENLTFNGTSDPSRNISIYACYQCWVKNVKSLYGARDHVGINLSLANVIRDSYFFSSQATGSGSYGIEMEESSGNLIENNIFQQTTAPMMFGQTSGTVVGYNFSIDNQFVNNYVNGSYFDHNAGNEMNLWEGNSFVSVQGDDAWGASTQQTFFRNALIGWGIGRTNSTFPVMMRSFIRSVNMVGNVLGQPGYHNNYQSYATSATGGSNQASENTSIYSLGWGGTGAACGSPNCDPKVFSTLMRWGNYDTVNGSVQWNTTEASPAAATYVNANFTSSYFGTLAHTLPASLYYNSQPSWWPSGKAWPPIGPDVASGNVGMCTGTYKGAQATSGGQCSGGTLSSAWASHVTSIPAQDCFLNVMGGPPDGSGGVLNFDASTCYTSSGTGTTTSTVPTQVKATAN